MASCKAIINFLQPCLKCPLFFDVFLKLLVVFWLGYDLEQWRWCMHQLTFLRDFVHGHVLIHILIELINLTPFLIFLLQFNLLEEFLLCLFVPLKAILFFDIATSKLLTQCFRHHWLWYFKIFNLYFLLLKRKRWVRKYRIETFLDATRHFLLILLKLYAMFRPWWKVLFPIRIKRRFRIVTLSTANPIFTIFFRTYFMQNFFDNNVLWVYFFTHILFLQSFI